MNEPRPLVVASFNEALAVSGITTWNFRCAETLAATPELGIDWRIVEVGEAPLLERLKPVIPAAVADATTLIEKRPDENRWSVARRIIRQADAVASADVVLPNHCAEGWLTAALLRKKAGSGPAVVGVIHSDVHRFYSCCGLHVTPLEAVVAVSRRCQREFARYCPDRPAAEYVSYGVPIVERIPDRAAGPLRLIYSGRIETVQKRVLDLVALARHLADRRVEFELHIVGSGSAESELRAGLECIAPARIHMHGAVPPQRALDLLANCDAFVLVSEFEGTSVAMLEAMGRGVVPVVTDVSGAADIIESGRNGWIVGVGDMQTMAERLAALAGDPELLRRTGLAARAAVAERYSLDASARGLARVLHAAVLKPRPSLTLRRGHPALGVFDRAWLPNGLAIAGRRAAKAVFGRQM